MQLKLQYRHHISHSTCAAYIRGSSPGIWLKEINRWEIPIHQLECYPIPESIQVPGPAGLFVVFKKGVMLKNQDFLDPYGVIADKLYVPTHAELVPQASTEELSGLLLWELQIFHPTIGLVGFEKSDMLDLSELLHYTLPQESNWKFAHPGLDPKPKLRQIQVKQPNVEDVIESFKESIEKKPLSEIPKKTEDESSPFTTFIDNIKRGLLKGTLKIFQKIKNALSGDGSYSSNSNISPVNSSSKNNDSPGLLERFENWMLNNLEELERKRNDEIKRLLNLFDEDTDEALKYAIPLDSQYLGRGAAPHSDKLGRNSTSFNLGTLGGGGGPADVWNVGIHFNDLRSKYLKAAQKEIESKNFKKAAYVYAHLLNDFNAAANVLEQGKYYREAAVLYKDHIKNPQAAADCLEKGGLLLEAIELLVQLSKYEKVGDLYKKINQTDHAEQYYEKTIELVLKNGDYLDAARLMDEKLEKPDQAMQTLITGWKDSKQSEACLKRYFDLKQSSKNSKLEKHIEDIFVHHTPDSKKTAFLNVLTYLNEKSNDQEVANTSRNIAYEIISEQANAGNLSNLNALKKFLPEDRLISSDCSRFSSKEQKRMNQISSSLAFNLDKTIRWIKATCHRNQFLALGIKNSCLHIARSNWYGNVEYYSWSDHVEADDHFTIIADPYQSNKIILHFSRGIAMEQKKLSRNKYFDDELVITCPTWLSKGFAGFKFNADDRISALKVNSYAMSIHHYSGELQLQRSVDCKFDSEDAFLMSPSDSISELIYRNRSYYTFTGNFLIKISDDGIAQRSNLNANINILAATALHDKSRLAVGTADGFFLFELEPGEFKMGSDFFTHNIIPVDLKFISGNILVAAGKHKAEVYQISDGAEMKHLHTFETKSPIVAILSTSTRNQCALLEETGRISVYALN